MHACLLQYKIMRPWTRYLLWKWLSILSKDKDDGKVVTIYVTKSRNSSTHKPKEGNIGSSTLLIQMAKRHAGIVSTTTKEEYVHPSAPTHLYSSVTQNLPMWRREGGIPPRSQMGEKACSYRQPNSERGICASLHPHPTVQLCTSEPSNVTEGGERSFALSITKDSVLIWWRSISGPQLGNPGVMSRLFDCRRISTILHGKWISLHCLTQLRSRRWQVFHQSYNSTQVCCWC